MILSGLVQFSYDSRRQYFSERDVFVNLPSGKTLKVLSFGYHRLVADLLFIWSIQFYSNYHYTNRFNYIEHVYDVITDLSPKFKAAYYIGSIIMALEAKEYEMAIRLLQKGSQNMNSEWVFDYESGYYASKFLKDYQRAQRFYAKALQNPNAPPLVRRLHAHMTYMKDNLEEAYVLWQEIYNNARSELETNAAIHHLYQIKFEIDKKFLDEKLNRYRKRYGQYPMELSELLRVGAIKSIPVDFNGDGYIYQRDRGTIAARKSFKWK
jgi:tetratricopeptide (TPR) repeat protein